MAALVAVAGVLLPSVAFADVFEDHLIVKVGAIGVLPDEEAALKLNGVGTPGTVKITDEAVPSVQLEYKFTKNI